MDVIRALQTPQPQYSACAFWFWNGELSSARMLWQMDEMRAKGVRAAFMHARAYLKTPYMGDDWFRAMDDCVRHAKDIGFSPWLYDEYAWPSGTCGSVFAHGTQAPSRVLAKGRRSMAKGLDAEILDGDPDPERRLIAACPLADGRTMAFYEHVYEKAVDYLNPDAIRDFLDCTHEVYKARYGAEFGAAIPGIFFDEIYLAAHPLPWTDRLPEAFQETYGYNLLERLPALMQGGDAQSQTVRRDYYALLAALYEEAFFKQIADWCTENNLRLTGHTEENLLRHPRRQGDYFRTMRRLHVPGADCHDYRYRFPREISVHEPKFAVSVARAYGKPRAMSEAMGGAGWGCSLQEYKRGINALGAMGINLFILHGFYNDCEHQGSQADWPGSFFFQNPYWKYFLPFARYIQRVSTVNSLGEAVALINCSECGKRISSYAKACPECGNPMPQQNQSLRPKTVTISSIMPLLKPDIFTPKQKIKQLIPALLIIIGFILVIIHSSNQYSLPSWLISFVWVIIVAGFIAIMIIASINSARMTANDRQARQINVANHQRWLQQNNIRITSQLMIIPDFVEISEYQQYFIINYSVWPFPMLLGSSLNTVTTTKTEKPGSIGRAVVGGMIAGAAGAIVGATTAKEEHITKTDIIGLTIYFADPSNPSIELSGDADSCIHIHDTIRAIVAKYKSNNTNQLEAPYP